jgi:hypothetical protein
VQRLDDLGRGDQVQVVHRDGEPDLGVRRCGLADYAAGGTEELLIVRQLLCRPDGFQLLGLGE